MKQIEIATESDIKELYDLQLVAFESEAEMVGSRNVPALMETYEHSCEDFKNWTTLIKRDESGKIIGAARFQQMTDYDESDNFSPAAPHFEIGRVMVAPDHRNQGIAMELIGAIEEYAPSHSPSHNPGHEPNLSPNRAQDQDPNNSQDQKQNNSQDNPKIKTAQAEESDNESVFELYTCTKSYININLYEKLGYEIFKTEKGDRDLSFAYLRKTVRT